MNLVTRRDAGDEALGGRSAVGPAPVSRAVARARAVRHLGIQRRRATPNDTGVDGARGVRLHRRAEPGVPSARSQLADITLVHRGVVPAAVRGGRVGARRARSRFAITRRTASTGSLASPARSTPRPARSPSRSPRSALREVAAARGPMPDGLDAAAGRQHPRLGLAIADARREFDAGLPTDTIPHLIAAYGSRFRDVMDLAARSSRLADARRAGLAGHWRGAGPGRAPGDGAGARRHRHPADAARRGRVPRGRGARAGGGDRRARAGMVDEKQHDEISTCAVLPRRRSAGRTANRSARTVRRPPRRRHCLCGLGALRG